MKTKIFVPSSWALLNSGTVSIESESVPGMNYFVGIKTLKCSCPSALNGFLCKHARWVHDNRELIMRDKKGGLG